MDLHETFKLISNLIIKQVNKDVEDFGLTCSQSSILIYILLSENEVNQRNIEQFFQISNPTVNGILKRLEKKEFIKKVPSSTDSRVKNIVALPKAQEFKEQLEYKKKMLESIMLKNINFEELNIFYIVLEKIKNNLKENLDERNF